MFRSILGFRAAPVARGILRSTRARPARLIRAPSAVGRFQSSTASVQLPKQELMLAFTCNKCSTRSSHTISKQAYTGGTVLVQCPGCHNRHLIADHLKIFKDNRFSIEELMEVSKSTDDLVFDEIPEKLKKTLGYYAKDAPSEYRGSEAPEDEVKKIK